jgi:chemotaxis protein histidine kinase CheA
MMDFRSLASHEFSELLERLTAETAATVDAAVRQARQEAHVTIDAQRAEIDEYVAMRATLSASLQEAEERLEELIRERDVHARALEAAQLECELAREEQQRAETARAEAETARSEAETAYLEAEAARADSETARAEAEAGYASAEAARSQAEAAYYEAETARAQAEAAYQDADAARAQVEAAYHDAEAARARAEAAYHEAEAARVEAEAARTEADASRLQAEAARADAEAARAQAETARLDAEAARLDAEAGRAEAEAARLDAEGGRADAEAARADMERELAEIRALLLEMDVLRAERDEALAAEARFRDGLIGAEREIAELQAASAASAAFASEAGTELLGSSTDRLLSLFARIEPSGTDTDILGSLANALAMEFSRVALFSVAGRRLEGVLRVGFDLRTDASNLAIPLTVDSLLTRAAAAGTFEALSDNSADGTRTLFGGAPGLALALPIVTDGNTVAVLYADDSGQPAASQAEMDRKITIARLLLGHATPFLGRVQSDPGALDELRDYAALLIAELEYTYDADVRAGTKDDALRQKLTENLDCARRIYAQRVADQGPRAAALLDAQLAATTRQKASDRFGRDLAQVSSPTGEGAPRTAAAAAS